MKGIPRRSFLGLALAGVAWPLVARAQAWGDKPLRLVHGFGPGSTIDVVTRPLAQGITELLGQKVVVEGRPGATGTIANEMVVRSLADGHTLLVAPLSAVVTSAHLFPIRYDPLKDLLPVIQVARLDTVLVVSPRVEAQSLSELVAQAKAKPGALSYASPGIGTGFHLAGELLQQTAGIKMVHVPYAAGGKAALSDLLTGRIDLMFESIGAMRPYLAPQQLRALAVTGVARSPALPEVPTVGEAGLPGAEIDGWHGVFAPAGTPANVVQQINATVTKVLGLPDLQKLWQTMDMQFSPNTPERFAEKVRADYQRYGKLIASAGIKMQ
jgi:tripartite-type tricarboxylate transporter receptor subunit TctC